MRRRLRVYIGCEGDSERAYIRWLQNRLDEAGLHVHLDTYVSGGGDPLAVVGSCALECLRRERLLGPFVVRAVFLDDDKLGEAPERDRRIDAELKRAKFAAVFQVHDHEALLLRHFDGQHTKRPAKGRSLRALRRVWPEYVKPADAMRLSARLDLDALKRAIGVEPSLRAFLEAVGFKVAPARRR